MFTLRLSECHWLKKILGLFLALPLLVMAENGPHICVTMIVRNDSTTIERCLSQAQTVADCFCVCDMGSSDGTAEAVESFLHKTGLPGKVYRHDWKNFGYNRTLAIKAAQEMVQTLGFLPKETYLLLLDGSIGLKATPDFSKTTLTAGAYRIWQRGDEGVASCDGPRLLRADLPWESVGPVYDYVQSPAVHEEAILDSLWIEDASMFRAIPKVHSRNIALLQESLKEDGENARNLFYLGYSHLCMRNYDEAIHWFTKRTELPGDLEELWCAKYMLGECYLKKNDFMKGLSFYLKAFASRPTRAEPVQRLSRYCRDSGVDGAVYHFAKLGLKIPFPSQDRLFISFPAYSYDLDEDLSVAAFYCSASPDEAVASIDRLILRKTTPQNVREQAYRNLVHYLHPLENAVIHPISFKLPPLYEGSLLTFQATNPSIQKVDDGYLVLCRTLNYCKEKGMWQGFLDQRETQIRTRNFLLKYSKDFTLLSQKEVVDTMHLGTERIALGMEDCRLFFDPLRPGALAVTCSVYEENPNNIARMAYCTLDEKEDVVKVASCTTLKGPQVNRAEKNWLPYFTGSTLHAIYSCSPFLTYIVDRKTGVCTQDLLYEPSHNFEHFRGSAPPIAFDDGYLAMVHEVLPPKNSAFVYVHRFIFLDKDYRVVKVSMPFSFIHTGIEFSCGMTLDHEGKNLIIGCGSEDKEAFLLSVDVQTVRSSLKDLPS